MHIMPDMDSGWAALIENGPLKTSQGQGGFREASPERWVRDSSSYGDFPLPIRAHTVFAVR
jgi:hypothetical protein